MTKSTLFLFNKYSQVTITTWPCWSDLVTWRTTYAKPSELDCFSHRWLNLCSRTKWHCFTSTGCHSQPAAAALEQHHMDLAGPEFQSVLDVNSLLKLGAAGEHMKDDREGEMLWYESSETEQISFCNCIQQWSSRGSVFASHLFQFCSGLKL